ncbi:MAG: type IV toxin-antitoxin system AbiEi family antitoxin domain-containing protein [Candidatus Zixiibacteriota bacterium]
MIPKDPIEIFKKHGGQLRMKEAINAGISRYRLYNLRDKGIIEQVSRGVYRLVELPPLSNPDLATVSLRYPNSVICLISALAFHNITTQIPHEVSIAVERKTRLPSLEYPPISSHRFSRDAFKAGIEEHKIDGITVKVYNPEKTIADCFKFRNKFGMEIVLEALKLYKSRRKFKINSLLKYARICRVEKIIKPYLEAMI